MSRKSCTCDKCVAACLAMPGYLVPGDLRNIPAGDLAASEGALVVYRGQITAIPTIVPLQQDNGRCVFLDDNDRCTIHAVAPWGCRKFNVCETVETPQTIRDKQLGLRLVFEDMLEQGPYQALRQTLPSARPLQDRRTRLLQLLYEIERSEENGRLS